MPDFEKDLEKLKFSMIEDDEFARDVYRALCNNDWFHKESADLEEYKKAHNKREKKLRSLPYRFRRWTCDKITNIRRYFLNLGEVRKKEMIPCLGGDDEVEVNTLRVKQPWKKLNELLLRFQMKIWPIVTYPNFDWLFSCSWRYAGGLVASIRDCGENYLDFYCSGDEGSLAAEEDLNKLGWYLLEQEDDEPDILTGK